MNSTYESHAWCQFESGSSFRACRCATTFLRSGTCFVVHSSACAVGEERQSRDPRFVVSEQQSGAQAAAGAAARTSKMPGFSGTLCWLCCLRSCG